jgi:hypothetical protein
MGLPFSCENKHIYMTTHACYMHSNKKRQRQANYLIGPTPLLVEWCGHVRVFQMWVKCIKSARQIVNLRQYRVRPKIMKCAFADSHTKRATLKSYTNAIITFANRYGIYVSQITTDMLLLSQPQSYLTFLFRDLSFVKDL